MQIYIDYGWRPGGRRRRPSSALYGLRSGSEAMNAAYRRTRLADLGWRRQLPDLISWAIVTTAPLSTSHTATDE